MNEPHRPPLRGYPWLDLGLCAVAALVLASIFQLQLARTGPPSPASPLEVRQVELRLKAYDAGQGFGTAEQELLGLDGERATGPAALLGRDVAELEARRPWAHRLRLVLASLAVGFDAPDVALAQLEAVAEAAEALEAHRPLVVELHRLATGRRLATPESTLTALEALGASRWLRERVEAAHLSASGSGGDAATLRERARARAQDHGAWMSLLQGLSLMLMILGVLLAMAWPLVRRALVASGHPGLGAAPSPFEPQATWRVVAAWVLFQVALGVLLDLASRAGLALSGGMLLALQTLAQGGAAIALIRAFARRPQDTAPLVVPLRLSRGVGGVGRAFMWGVGATALVVAAQFTGTALSLAWFGQPPEPHGVVLVFHPDAPFTSQALAAASAAVFAPVFEEILFRGFIYRNLRDGLGPFTAAAASGLLFALVHMQPAHLLEHTLIGVALAVAYERSGSLVIPIVAHGLYNTLQVLLVYGSLSG